MEAPTITMQETVEAMYLAFSKGDIPFILDHVAEDFTWEDPCNPAIVPFGGMHKNKAGFQDFFQKLSNSTDSTLWEVDEYITGKNGVVAVGRHEISCKKTGKIAMIDWAMVWHFKNGQPAAGRTYYNTAAVEDAFK